MKQLIKKILLRVLNFKINKKGILTIRKGIPFLKRVSLTNDTNTIYLIRTAKSHTIDLKTIEDLSSYSLFMHFQITALQFKIKLPINISGQLNQSSLYSTHMKEPLEKGLVIFESFFGKSYSGQPKYIYEYLLSLNLPYQYVWTYQGDIHNIPGNPKIVKRGSIEYFKVLATAEYWVNNIVFPVQEKRAETTYLQTWHGTPLKKLGYDIEVEGPEVEAREKFYAQSRTWDYLITQNSYTSEILKRAFKYDNKIIESGYPHNDILVDSDPVKIKQIKDNLGIEQNKKVILYTPTWRDNDANGNWSFDFTLRIDLPKWQEVLGDEYIILIRMHHLITNIKGLDEAKGFAYNVSMYDDVQELSLVADILITDYSSVFFDYAVSKKPILFYAYDFKEYAEKLRGFYLDMHTEMPGPIIEKDKDLLSAIINIEEIEQQYANRYNTFVKKFCYLDNGTCSKQVSKIVFKDIHA